MQITLTNQTPFGPTSWAIVRAIREEAERIEQLGATHGWNPNQAKRSAQEMYRAADEMEAQLEAYTSGYNDRAAK